MDIRTGQCRFLGFEVDVNFPQRAQHGREVFQVLLESG